MIRTSFAALTVSGCLCMFALSSPVEVLQELNIQKSFERERGKQKIRYSGQSLLQKGHYQLNVIIL